MEIFLERTTLQWKVATRKMSPPEGKRADSPNLVWCLPCLWGSVSQILTLLIGPMDGARGRGAALVVVATEPKIFLCRDIVGGHPCFAGGDNPPRTRLGRQPRSDLAHLPTSARVGSCGKCKGSSPNAPAKCAAAGGYGWDRLYDRATYVVLCTSGVTSAAALGLESELTDA